MAGLPFDAAEIKKDATHKPPYLVINFVGILAWAVGSGQWAVAKIIAVADQGPKKKVRI